MKKQILSSVIIVGAFAVQPSFAAKTTKKDCLHDATTFKCAEYVRNSKGDTVIFNIPHTHPIIASNLKVKLSSVKTASNRSKNKCASNKAKDATHFTRNLLKKAKRINISDIKRDKRFGVAGEIIIDNKKLSKLLLENKLAVKSDKKEVNWCKV